jgi:RNA polymerase sigma-70 factor (ECF subfamily)
MRRAAVNIYNRRTRQKRVPSELTDSLDELDFLIAHEGGVDSELDAEQLGKVISDFVRSLPTRGRYIFMSRYYAAEPIERIASTLSVSRSTVNKEIAAIKHGLRQKLESEGYYI